MAIPRYRDLYPNVLKVLSDGKEYSTRELDDIIIPTLNLTEEELEARLSSGNIVIRNRLGWCRTFLKKAGLIESRKRGYINITDAGLNEFRQNPNLVEEDLWKYPSFVKFVTGDKSDNYSKEEPGEEIDDPFTSDKKRNIIYFGAPGTGKSYNLNNDKDELTDDFERVTFHPDYSYANFVGTYKPVSDEKGISYEYIPGPFMRVLVKALKNPNKAVLLIIEEINRANTAAVFGEIFQLLDRDENNESTFPIETSEDIRNYLKKELNKDYDKIKIPQNMFIWATMNSADQGVFPMDTAFKRRWDFEYFGINYGEENIKDTFVNLNDEKISWNKLRIAINNQLLEYKINEDKLLGPFFAFTEYLNQEIPSDVFKEVFQNKIIMYLFEDAARSRRNDLFEGSRGDKTYVTYSKICDDFNSKIMGIFCDSIRNADISVDDEQ